MYITVGFIAAIVSGAGMPSASFLFGNIINGFGGTPDEDVIIQNSKNMLYIGLGIFVTAYIYVANFQIAAERIAFKTKVGYLRAILNQEVAWFDTNNVAEMSSRLSKETTSI